jgi:2-amino-4-hydroxy-6-hydroxymethyldihydropteridine diphosphokinase
MLRSAVEHLQQLRAAVTARSAVYETAPVGPPQPDYLNAAVLVETSMAPLALFDAMLAIERELGRVRLEKWGPRTIDLDLLFIQDVSVNDPRLVVPHPHLRERAFALLPLLDVLPNAHVGTERLVDLRIDPAGVRKTDLSLF